MVCTSGFVIAQEVKIQEILKRGFVKVATGSTSVGFCVRGPDGKTEGMDVDIAKLLAKSMFEDENKLELTTVTGSGRIPAVVSRKVDVVICAMTITPDRALKAAFTLPYAIAGQMVFARKDTKATKIEDLNKQGVKIAMFNASHNIKTADTYCPKAEKLVFETLSEALLAIRSGRAQAMLTDAGPAKEHVKADKNLVLINKLLTTQNFGMLVNLQDVEWLYYLNTFVRELRTGFYKNEYRAMHLKWFGEEPPPM